jgi:protein-S-isoprenylcysteine O-methyltransferase Ste14
VADVAGLALIALATGLRAHVAATAPRGTSGRNRTRQLATSLSTTGLYSLVRHPLYFANLMAWAGVGLLSGSWWVAGGTIAVGLAFYGPIVVAEDAFLERSFGDAHREWVARTPSLIPRLRGWRPAATRIQWRTLLRREYPSSVVIATAVYLVHAARTIEWPNPASVSVAWTTAFALVLAGALCLRLISHRTDLLETSRLERESGAPADSAAESIGRRRP